MASEACCKAGPPVTVDHTDKGKEITLKDITAYVSGNQENARAGVLLLYDIFGMPNFLSCYEYDLILLDCPHDL